MPNTPKTPSQPKKPQGPQRQGQRDIDRDVEDDRQVHKGPGGQVPSRTDVEREMPSGGDPADIERATTSPDPGVTREMDERRPHRDS